MTDISCTVACLVIDYELLVLGCFVRIMPFSRGSVVEPAAPGITNTDFRGIDSVAGQNGGRPQTVFGIYCVFKTCSYSLRCDIRNEGPVICYMAAVRAVEGKCAAQHMHVSVFVVIRSGISRESYSDADYSCDNKHEEQCENKGKHSTAEGPSAAVRT